MVVAKADGRPINPLPKLPHAPEIEVIAPIETHLPSREFEFRVIVRERMKKRTAPLVLCPSIRRVRSGQRW